MSASLSNYKSLYYGMKIHVPQAMQKLVKDLGLRFFFEFTFSKASYCILKIEHSENKIITNFENEVGPGVFQTSVQQTLPWKSF